jgi:MSHA biogenesis protein MshQ
MPTFQVAGSPDSGNGTVKPVWPTHQVDDIGLLFVETSEDDAAVLSVPAGFVQVANSPQATNTGMGSVGTRISVFWARATSTAMPTPSIAPTQHTYARIITYRGVINSGDPWDVTGGGIKNTTSNSVTVTGVTTTVPDTLIVQAVARDNDSAAAAFSNQTNANLTGLTERSDAGTTSGDGGGFAVWDGGKATAGATGNTTATVTSSVNAFLTIALKPAGNLNHIRLAHDGSGVTCTSSAVTVTACADAACSTTYTGSVTVDLAPAGWATDPVTFSGGSTTAYLSITTPSTVTLGATATSPTAANATRCFVGATETCSHTFADTGFIFSSAANGAEATIPTQTAGVSSGTYYLRAVKTGTSTKACEAALAGANSVDFAYECNNPTTCSGANLMSVNGGTATTIARNNNGSVASYTSVSMAFDANGNAPFTFNYGDVGQVKLHARKVAGGALLSTLTGASNAFVVKPYGFTVTDIKRTSDSVANPAAADATGTAFAKAGESFTATVTAIANGGATTPNYGRESVAEGVLLTPALAAGLGLANNPALTNDTVAGGSFTSGVATPTNLAWNEVGIITLTPSVGDGDYLGAGDVTGTATGNVGRFYPDHFELSAGAITTRTDIAPACAPASTFTYMDEPFQAGFTLTAKGPAPGNVTLQNYVTSATPANNFAKLATGAPIPAGFGLAFLDGATNLSSRVDGSLGITGSWTAGALAATATLGFTRSTAPDGPYNAMRVGVAPVDADGVTLSAFDMDVTAVPAGNDHAEVAQTQIRFGRLRLSNAHGSELLDLPIPIQLQHWNGTLFVTNTADSCTTLASSSVSLTKSPGTLPTTLSPATISFASGVGSMTLSKPLATGSVDLCVDLGTDPVGGTTCSATIASKAYLQGKWPPGSAWNNDPKARATFGVYRNANEFIYMREMY